MSAVADRFLTREDIRTILMTQYGLSLSKTKEVIRGLEKSDPHQELKISGVLSTHGGSAYAFVKKTGIWKNVWVTFKDQDMEQVISTNCLFDLKLTTGGVAYGLDYRYMIMFILGDMPVADLDGATFGTGVGVNFTPFLGIDITVLPANNTPNTMIIMSGNVGVGVGLVFPTAEFVRTQSCPNPSSRP